MSRKILIFSPGVIWSPVKNDFYEGFPQVIHELIQQGVYIAIVSNHTRRPWFDQFPTGKCFWVSQQSRQNGKWIDKFISDNTAAGLKRNELVILGASGVDLQMATNSKSLLIRCDWADDVSEMQQYGVGWETPKTLPELVKYIEDEMPWYYKSSNPAYEMFALTDAGTLGGGKDAATIDAVNTIRGILKTGRSDYRNRLVLHMMSSIYKTDDFLDVEIFGYYPSSKSTNSGEEIMAGFCRYAREVFKKRHKEPIFVRHVNAQSRHTQYGGDKKDPSEQIASVHLNPHYRGKLAGKVILIMDDYLTHGVSFGLARALLKAAGAKKVICVALGKFGNTACEYQININKNDPFKPLPKLTWSTKHMSGNSDAEAGSVLKKKFGPQK